jgi:A/G-specific adenine glycosylase
MKRAATPASRIKRKAAATPAKAAHTTPPKKRASAKTDAPAAEFAALDPAEFRGLLMHWYGEAARQLPWRGATDPYRIWVSEIMLQQTRVAAVIEHYNEFLRRFPTLVALALAAEADVLAAWSGLGYYRRARMLHKAAQFIMLERDGRLPPTTTELRTLPGIGEYTAAAIASIAFGERIAVVDGNVERVVLRLTGSADEATAAARVFVRRQAQALMPAATVLSPKKSPERSGSVAKAPRPRPRSWDASERIALAASAHPAERAGGEQAAERVVDKAAGDHNQAMMELGATVCLPRTPLCEQCPVFAMCRTRGEHATRPRGPQRSQPAAYLLDLRKRGPLTEVLLELREGDAKQMPAMFELPQLPIDATGSREPVLRVRHSITNTNYYVQVFAPPRWEPGGETKRTKTQTDSLRRAIKGEGREQHWVRASQLPGLPITGLTRKILQRLRVMDGARMALLE